MFIHKPHQLGCWGGTKFGQCPRAVAKSLQACSPPKYTWAWGSEKPTCAPPPHSNTSQGPAEEQVRNGRRAVEADGGARRLSVAAESGCIAHWLSDGLDICFVAVRVPAARSREGQRPQPDPIKQSRAGLWRSWASLLLTLTSSTEQGAPRGPRALGSRCCRCQISLGYGFL